MKNTNTTQENKTVNAGKRKVFWSLDYCDGYTQRREWFDSREKLEEFCRSDECYGCNPPVMHAYKDPRKIAATQYRVDYGFWAY